MDILIEEFLTIKNQKQELEKENEKESYTTRYFANKAKIEELEVAAAWALTKLSGQDERSQII